MNNIDTTSGATQSVPGKTNQSLKTDIINNKTGVPLSQYRASYADISPELIAERCRVDFDGSSFSLTLLGHPVAVSHPDGIASYGDAGDAGKTLDDEKTILVLRYLTEGTKVPWSGEFIAYADMPWGETYLQQFTGRCISRLANTYGNDLDTFARCAEAIGGTATKGGDAAYDIPFMENLVVKLIVWGADEEFPPSAQILFSDNFKTAFTAEDLAHVGDIILNAMQSAM